MSAILDNDPLAPIVPSFEPLLRLNADLKAAARFLGRKQIRALVDTYYQVQEVRKASFNQALAAEPEGEPNALVEWMGKNWRYFEDDVKKALGEVASSYRAGQWAQSITGIGPVISAGLLAQLDIRKAPTVGHFWRFAGYDPTVTWGKGQKRPWNAQLKTLCFKLGDCFVKFSNHPKQYYGTLYLERKAYEQPKNERGEYRDQAERSLAEKNYGKDTEARKWYEKGQLPPARIHMRCLRYAVKIFLSHLHHVMYMDVFDHVPPVPYSFEHSEGDHRHFIPLPNWDEDDPWEAYSGRSLADMGL